MDDEDRVLAYTIDNSASKHGVLSLGCVLMDPASLQQACDHDTEVYPDRTAAPRPLQGNGQREIVSPASTSEIPAYPPDPQ